MTGSDAAIVARGLSKLYGDVKALDNLDLDVQRGSVLGLLGPNGAGKTTAVSILSTLAVADSGTATIDGLDLATQPEQIRTRLGLSGQYAAVDEVLTGRENLKMIARLYRFSSSDAKKRADELLERFDLVESADRPAKGYSGGMRRRLDLAASIVASPPILFLDEPTTGLDPRSRIELWGVIRELVSGGTTLLLTTQYLEEADQLADEIVVIDKGKAIAKGTSDELKAQMGGSRVEITIADEANIDSAKSVMESLPGRQGDVEVTQSSRTLLASVDSGVESLEQVLQSLRAAGLSVTDVGLRRPTLDDVFLTLTGDAPQQDSEDK